VPGLAPGPDPLPPFPPPDGAIPPDGLDPWLPGADGPAEDPPPPVYGYEAPPAPPL